MKHLFNKIKPVGKRVIVLSKPEDKRNHKLNLGNGKSVDLEIATDFSWDSRITNITQGILLTDYKNLKAGTYVLAHHSSMGNECELVYDQIPESYKLFSVEEQFIYFGFKDGKVIPIDGYLLAERLYEPDNITKGGIILNTEPIKIHNKLRIKAKPESTTDFNEGDVVITYKYADYEMTHNLNGKQESIIRLKYIDCLAIDHEFDKRGY
jgi:co-chaperonin GroES (HSP10)